MSGRQVPGYTSPIAEHHCTIEMRPTTGWLPSHPLHAGEHRATCTDCMWDGAWGYLEDARKQATHHETWASADPGDARCTTPRVTSATVYGGGR